MRVSILRSSVCWMMLAAMPHCLLGQEVPAQSRAGAILQTQGGVWVNGYEAKDSSAVFPGDVIETKAGFSANLTVEGATILLSPQSLAKFGDNFIELEHGTVSVGTAQKFQVRIDCLRVDPVLQEWTQYDVTNVNRTIQVSAHKNDVNVERETGRAKGTPEKEAEQRASVHEGQQHGYDENEACGAPPGMATAFNALSPKWIAAEAGAGALVVCALVCKGGKNPPKQPNMSSSAP